MQGFFLLLLLFFAFYQFSLPLKTYARMLFLLFQQALRRTVGEALVKIGSSKAVRFLIQSLQDKDPYARRRIAWTLGKIGDEKAIIPLIQSLKDEDFYVRLKAIEALGNIGSDKAIESLTQFLIDKDPYVRRTVVLSLGNIGGEKVVESLSLYFNDEDPDIRETMVDVLGKIGSKKAVEILDKLIEDSDYEVREKVVEVLSKIYTDENIKYYKQILKHEDSDLLKSLDISLSNEEVELIMQGLNDKYQHVREKSVKSLEKIAEADRNLPALTQQLPHLLTLIPTEASQLALSVITAIQARCKYYNYDIAQTPLPPEDNPNPTTSNTYNFYDKVDQVVAGNLTVHGDNIATQNNQKTAPES